MATVDFSGLTQSFNIGFSEIGLTAVITATSDTFTWETAFGSVITATGSDFTFDANLRPTGGTFTSLTIQVRNAEPGTSDVVITDISAPLRDLTFEDGIVGAQAFWELVQDGPTTIIGPNSDKRVLLTGDMITFDRGQVTGSDANITGVFQFGSTIIGGISNLTGTATYRAGDVTFQGSAERIAMANIISDSARVFGGDDEIIYDAADGSTLGRENIRVYGDANAAVDDAQIYGGNDLIDARQVDHMWAFIYGDADTLIQNTRGFGGDDIIYAPDILSKHSEIYGDFDRVENNADVRGGNDTLYGGASDDEIYGDVGRSVTDYRGGNDTIYGGSGGNDSLYGQKGDDRIYATGDETRVDAGEGNDVAFHVGQGAATVFLGEGDDVLRAGEGDLLASGDEGTDRISYYAIEGSVVIDLEDNSATGDFAGTHQIFGFENVSGSRTDNSRIIGTDRANDIDTYDGNDKVYGGGGGDNIATRGGNDFISAGEFNNTYNGGSGRDTISYYNSDDGIRIDLRDNEASGGWAQGDTIKGFERVTGSRRDDDTLLGSNSGNIIKGAGGDDRLWGRGGTDKLYGGSGSDRLDGDAGTDFLYGGSGRDTFHFDKGDDKNAIRDFQNNADRIELDGFAKGTNWRDFAEQDGDRVVLDFGNGDILIIDDVLIGQLGNDLFLV